jgi:hypothetical protein
VSFCSRGGKGPYVKVIASRPPPAPAKACAMLSLCWATAMAGAGCGALGSVVAVDILLGIACGIAEGGRALEGDTIYVCIDCGYPSGKED